MLGRLLRLAVAAAVLAAAWRVGAAYYAHYEFVDEVEQIATRGVRTDEAEVRAAVSEAIARLGVPLDPALASIRVAGDHVYIDARYIKPVQLFPGYYHPWPFSVSAHGWVLPVRAGQGR